MDTQASNGYKASAIADTYALSPLQHGMLFNTLLHPGSGLDIEQVLCELNEPLDVAQFRCAWQTIVTRHPVLRTAFRWEGLAEPLQEVHAVVQLPWEEQDWRTLEAGERDQRVMEFMRADRRRGFDMAQAPLFRLTLLRCGADDYRLVWTLHHAVLDGRAYRFVLEEVFEAYASLRAGGEPSLPRRPPFRAYIDWLQHQDINAGETYWRGLLRGFAAATPLAIDRATAPGEISASPKATEELLVPGHASAMLREVARDEQVTVNTIVQGAWAILLSRYSGETDVVFGVVRATRGSTVAGAEDMVGLLVTTLPLRMQVEPDAPLGSWLRSLREQWVAMRGHEHAPLAKVQSWSELPPGSMLFHSTVMYERFDLNAHLRGKGKPWEGRKFRTFSQTNYPLDLTVLDGDALVLRLDFDPSRIDCAAARRMIGHVCALLEAMARKPKGTVGELELMSDAERHDVLVEWNRAVPGQQADTPMHELFAAQAARTPEATAVVSRGRAWSYAELDRRANRLAHYLRKRGVGPEVLVGIFLSRDLGMIAGLLAILKAGGAYVPLDPAYPPERLAFMLEDCGAKLLLTEEGLRNSLPRLPTGCEPLYIDWESPSAESCDAPDVKVDPSSLAYAIFTSGSTGKPKAALLTHRGLASIAANEFRLYGIGPQSRVLQFSSLSFDASLSEIAMALCSGAALHVEEREAILPGPNLEHYLDSQRVSVLSLTPSALAVLDPAAGAYLEQIIVGGEACPPELVSRWAGRCRFFNTYGPTEASIVTTFVEYRNGAAPPDIGRPLPNVRVYLLDRSRHPVPIGVPGELFIGGAGVARGYLNRPQLSAERFLPDPFSDSPGASMYRSGDFARWRADGHIEFIGRVDDQVKIRGFRIELGEIEARMMEYAGVREAVVIAREDVPGDPRLVAYVVPRNSQIGVADLKEWLSKSLPAYMVPSAFVSIERLPLTPNGKIDRKALPAPEGQAYAARAFEAPVGRIEIGLARIWSEVLRIQGVGRQDNFFELGGHSLLAMSVIERMRRAGLHADVRALFSAPTLAALASAVGSDSGIVEVPPNGIPPACDVILPEMVPLVGLTSEQIERIVAAVPGGAANVQDIYPLGPLQEGILFHHLAATEGDPYVASLAALSTAARALEGYLASAAGGDRPARHPAHGGAVGGAARTGAGGVAPGEARGRRSDASMQRPRMSQQQLVARFNPRHYRLDVRQAPMMRACVAFDAQNGRWLLLELNHHLSVDHVTLEVMREEIEAHRLESGGAIASARAVSQFRGAGAAGRPPGGA